QVPQAPRLHIQTHEIAIPQFSKWSASEAFRTEVNSCWHFPGGTGHAAIGHQCDLISLVLQDPEWGDRSGQFPHATGTRALEADRHDDISIEQAGDERLVYRFLAVEHCHWCFNDIAITGYRRSFKHRAAEIPLHEF